MKTPSETFLASVERELRKQPKGAQRAVGGEVYMRLDREGGRRFHYRGARTLARVRSPSH